MLKVQATECEIHGNCLCLYFQSFGIHKNVLNYKVYLKRQGLSYGLGGDREVTGEVYNWPESCTENQR